MICSHLSPEYFASLKERLLNDPTNRELQEEVRRAIEEAQENIKTPEFIEWQYREAERILGKENFLPPESGARAFNIAEEKYKKLTFIPFSPEELEMARRDGMALIYQHPLSIKEMEEGWMSRFKNPDGEWDKYTPVGPLLAGYNYLIDDFIGRSITDIPQKEGWMLMSTVVDSERKSPFDASEDLLEKMKGYISEQRPEAMIEYRYKKPEMQARMEHEDFGDTAVQEVFARDFMSLKVSQNTLPSMAEIVAFMGMYFFQNQKRLFVNEDILTKDVDEGFLCTVAFTFYKLVHDHDNDPDGINDFEIEEGIHLNTNFVSSLFKVHGFTGADMRPHYVTAIARREAEKEEG